MSLPPSEGSSTFMKMRQSYWEAKQAFNKSLGQREDSCIISSDLELDLRLDLLQAADNYFNSLMRVLLEYRSALQNFAEAQENFGSSLIAYGTKDTTAAGKVMCMSGTALCKAAQRHLQLKTSLMYLFHEVQTFQFKATSDALQTVAKMEKVRTSYRSGLMWMKNESIDLDPDVNKKLKNFRRIQEHIKHLKVRFDGVKIETLQKIDLFLLSRSNLFSHTLVPYRKTFKKIYRGSIHVIEFALKNIPLHLSYSFVTLKELNQYSNILHTSLQQQLISSQESRNKVKNKHCMHESKHMLPMDGTNHSCPSADGVCSSLVMKENIKLSPQTESTDEALLIDLNEECYKNKHSAAPEKNLSIPSKYSDDLMLINLDDPRYLLSTNVSLRNNNFTSESKSLNDTGAASNQRPCYGESSELQFWTLIHNLRPTKKSSRPSENEEHQITDSTPPLSKDSSNILSDSKWNDILVQFDPFGDEFSRTKDNSGILETC